ncbi:MAG: 2OG-Fe(II) oxygenase, partial [Dermatophilaceae bacterium]
VAPREEIAEMLGAVGPAAAPGTRLQAKPTDVLLEVVGVGRVGLPLSATQAKQLCGLGRPARFGRGEQTLTDRRVRDTWEIPKELVRVEWSAAFGSALEKVRDGLGLAPDRPLTAELHSVLVYEPGQFFAPHQDSEKDDAMVATLVVTLPSTHTGGELVVHQGGQATTYRTSKAKISLVAFYADCVHEVRPVTSGHRMALTYNLLLDGDPTGVTRATDPAVVERLADLIDAHLTTRRRHPYRDDVLDPPNRLVYLLDHEYSARGLSWSRLKGADASRAEVLRAAADAVDCDVALALTEIQETWDALEPDTRYARRRWSDDEAPNSGPEDYELQYLIDSSIRLTRWTDPEGTWAQDIGLGVGEDEVCATIPTVQLRPYESEFEGYMGNYGNTMDRWYRRAALIVWPRAHGFAIRAEISPLQALDEVVAAVRTSGRTDRAHAQAQARVAVEALAPFWDSVVRSQDQASFLAKALRAATVLEDAGTAATLLHPFRIETLRRSHVKALAKLAGRHGEQWTGALLATWFGDARQPYRVVTSGEDRSAWLARLPGLAEALAAEQDAGPMVGRHLLRCAWEHLRAELDRWLEQTRPSYLRTHIAPLGEPLAALLQAAAVLDAANLRDQVVADVRDRPDAVTICVVRALRAGATLPAGLRGHAGFPELAVDCGTRLRARLSRPARADDDWSLDPPAGCTCDLCAELGSFLRDPRRTTLDWPLAEQRRRHVHERIQSAELPVTHQTRRQGRPYVLVLTKSPTLFEQERKARSQDQADLDRLTAVWRLPADR